MGRTDCIAGKLHQVILLVCVLLAVPASAASLAPVPQPETGKFGGQVHEGSASLPLTAALLQAGGGAESFSTRAALVNMLGQEAADRELTKLSRQYGAAAVQSWLRISDWQVRQGLVQLRNIGTELPSPPDDLSGGKLAAALVDAGVAPGDGIFWSSYYYDHLFSHGVNKVLEEDMGRRYGERRARRAYAVNNQLMYDISQSVHAQDVRLATLH